MLITSLLPLLARYSLGFDLVAGPEETVTLTILPRVAEGSKATTPGELRLISITGTAAEIDAELGRGEEGALGQLIATRKALADQLAEQRASAEQAKSATAAKAKPAAKPAAEKPAASAAAAPAAPPPPAETKPGEPVSLW